MAVVATVTLNEMCDSIASEMYDLYTAGTVDVVESQSATNTNVAVGPVPLREGKNTLPAIQVYFESAEVDPGGETDRTTFCDEPVRQASLIFHVDVYVRNRSQLGEDWRNALTVVNEVWDKLAENCACPPFGQQGFQSFEWSMQRVVFQYASGSRGGPQYAGYRFVLTFRFF